MITNVEVSQLIFEIRRKKNEKPQYFKTIYLGDCFMTFHFPITQFVFGLVEIPNRSDYLLKTNADVNKLIFDIWRKRNEEPQYFTTIYFRDCFMTFHYPITVFVSGLVEILSRSSATLENNVLFPDFYRGGHNC